MYQHYELNTPTINNFYMKYYINNLDLVQNARTFTPHLHDMIEFYILIEGDASFNVEHSIYKLSSGDVIISRPNEVHNCIINHNSVHKHMVFWFDPNCDFIFEPFLDGEFGKNNLISLDEQSKKEIFNICKKIEESSLSEDKQGEFTYALQLIYELSKKAVSTDKSKHIPENLKNILNYINVKFAEIESIDDLAYHFFISRSTLCRLFSTHLHTSPKLYLETKRLANSRILLKRGKSVFDACMESGFTDYSNYIRLFKKRFGITPKRYKET